MGKELFVNVFGKAGCPKCKVLNQRLDKLMAAPDWQAFEKVYWDVETEEGLVAFCKAECINPSRIPAILVSRREEDTGQQKPVPNRKPGMADPVCHKSKLYTYLGLQTDYSQTGKGVITPKMLTSVLQEAKGA